MHKLKQPPPDEDLHDKVLESKMADLIGTTTKALQRKRERGVIPRGVWQLIDGRVMYSRRRYDEWVESLWASPRESKSSATLSGSASPGNTVAVKPLLSTPRRRVSHRPQVLELR
ncbi:hypothetical protein [Pseudomonas sp. BN414]|uniref:hypothetical protein n=1 Tax=Pseudomonas sp. BN414 TaxID=2567888 RepID=UPI002456E100|nr:hypothetical protein [Pseudomonas sp. BN414]